MKKFIYIVLISMVACSAPKSDQEVFSESQRQEAEAITAPTLYAVSELEQRLIDQGLVDLQEYIPGIRVELKYSTTDNFFGQDVYGELDRAYLQPEVADQLKKAQELLQAENPDYTLLVYDGVRPLSVQQILWDNLDKPDSIKPLYVADPKVGSLHNFGVAVDLTIYDTKADSALDMGTGYDYFGYPAYPDREKQMLAEKKITPNQVANREILRKVMNAAGFKGIGSEWWHFNAYTRKEAGEKFEIVQ
ncbi:MULTISPECIES: M15 family metallopeptidase [unclassified Algoriphagus]|uniref:M15 family metallopeptidase n=1 Tax=unclassified Algoriphagus TaxID=2641541 RepID=UPI00257AAB53|nr:MULTISPECIES: M15 family metallopeptidase [unclassified Algoriphagus]